MFYTVTHFKAKRNRQTKVKRLKVKSNGPTVQSVDGAPQNKPMQSTLLLTSWTLLWSCLVPRRLSRYESGSFACSSPVSRASSSPTSLALRLNRRALGGGSLWTIVKDLELVYFLPQIKQARALKRNCPWHQRELFEQGRAQKRFLKGMFLFLHPLNLYWHRCSGFNSI